MLNRHEKRALGIACPILFWVLLTIGLILLALWSQNLLIALLLGIIWGNLSWLMLHLLDIMV